MDVKRSFKFISGLLTAALCTLSLSILAFAQETQSVASVIGTAATSAATEAQSVITTLLPIVMGVVGTIAVVTLGIRLFRRFLR